MQIGENPHNDLRCGKASDFKYIIYVREYI